jgi:uncharacterized protein YjbJ (UPF0337 family)
MATFVGESRQGITEAAMNKDQIKGKIDNLKGRVKEALGAASGDKRTEAEGFGERVKGAVQKKFGDAKEAVSRSGNDDDGSSMHRRIEEDDDEDR